MFSESKHVNLLDAKELSTKDDYDFVKSENKQKLVHKRTLIRKDTIDKQSFDKSFEEASERIYDEDALELLYEELKNGFENVSPLIYLNPDQRKKMLDKIYFIRHLDKSLLYSSEDHDDLNCYILMEGEMHIFNKKNVLSDIISGIHFFGYQGPIFKTRNHTVVIEKDSIVGVIKPNDFLDILCPFSKFSKFISRNILNKDKVFSELDEFKSYVLHCVDNKNIDIDKLISLYKKIDSCLHTKACSNSEIDFNAWSYAINRLPSNIFTTFTYILINKIPAIFSTKEKVAMELIPKVQTELRNRDVFKYMEGKSMVIVRELETDVLDFVANLCIHIIESKKVRRLLNSPLIIAALYENKNLPCEELVKKLDPFISSRIDINSIYKVFKHFNISQTLLNILLHNEDYSISIMKGIVNDKDPIENFIQNLWINSKQLLNITTHVDTVNDLIVDIMQGSKRTLINCISPHIYINKVKIIKWAMKEIKDKKLTMKTPSYLNADIKYLQELYDNEISDHGNPTNNTNKSSEEKYNDINNDLLMAYSYYYYKTFPEEDKEKKKLEEQHGIKYITQTFSTGVGVILINPNKFNTQYIDQNIGFKKPVSKNHLIIHIGYTFGAQSREIIKPILLLFGSKARSLNVMGKAGGLCGKRSDVLISNKVFYDKINDVSNLEIGKIDLNRLDKTINTKHSKVKTDVHIGPMLTVSGTILQNKTLLLYYKNVMGCIGLEMEGYFYAKEIESAVKHMILQNKFYTRCFYYVSDLPLEPGQNLASEADIVSWEEGVQTMNAIQRYILTHVLNDK